MASVKVTFTLDQETIQRLETAAERLSRPKSQVIREAVQDYYDRLGRLSERERIEKLRVFDKLLPLVPSRPAREVDRELKAIRRERRSGGRKTITAK
jgi:predicted DNA-binding protein